MILRVGLSGRQQIPQPCQEIPASSTNTRTDIIVDCSIIAWPLCGHQPVAVIHTPQIHHVLLI